MSNVTVQEVQEFVVAFQAKLDAEAAVFRKQMELAGVSHVGVEVYDRLTFGSSLNWLVFRVKVEL